jgi:hypothetical protein
MARFVSRSMGISPDQRGGRTRDDGRPVWNMCRQVLAEKSTTETSGSGETYTFTLHGVIRIRREVLTRVYMEKEKKQSGEHSSKGVSNLPFPFPSSPCSPRARVTRPARQDQQLWGRVTCRRGRRSVAKPWYLFTPGLIEFIVLVRSDLRRNRRGDRTGYSQVRSRDEGVRAVLFRSSA